MKVMILSVIIAAIFIAAIYLGKDKLKAAVQSAGQPDALDAQAAAADQELARMITLASKAIQTLPSDSEKVAALKWGVAMLPKLIARLLPPGVSQIFSLLYDLTKPETPNAQQFADKYDTLVWVQTGLHSDSSGRGHGNSTGGYYVYPTSWGITNMLIEEVFWQKFGPSIHPGARSATTTTASPAWQSSRFIGQIPSAINFQLV